MKASDLPLLLSSNLVKADSEQYPMDRIRMQKAVFMLVQRGPEGWKTLYDYKPYNWGPYSGALTADLGMLASRHMIEADGTVFAKYPGYVASSDGERQAQELWSQLPEREKRFLMAVRAYVTTKSFPQLLREVYAAYPDFATKSQFAG